MDELIEALNGWCWAYNANAMKERVSTLLAIVGNDGANGFEDMLVEDARKVVQEYEDLGPYIERLEEALSNL